MADPSDLFEEFHPFPFFSPDPGSGSESESESDNPLTLDLFCRRRRLPSRSPPPSTMEYPDFLGLTLGLGFPNHEDDVSDRRDGELGRTRGLRFPNQEDDVNGQRDHELIYDSGDEFFIGRRSPGSSTHPIDEDGLRILGFESDDDEERMVAISEVESGLPLCWDCLRLDEGEIVDDFQWEEIDSHAEEGDFNTAMYDDENEGENAAATIDEEESPNDITRDLLMQEEETASNWEVLLIMHQFGNPSAVSHIVEDLDYADGFFVYTSEYDEVLFGQFQEHEGPKGSPPAARSVVEGLPTVVLRKEDVGEGSVSCAVCKDDILFEEKAKKLPCCHYYHEECILPWLGMRNTCPLCRYELPTDDAEYENQVGRAVNNEGQEETIRYGFEFLPED